ncbi:MAG TPA: prepilin peptidase [Candidatus Acidoferrum sp.]|nr:prepilin peptidase [Candidatus Acidoferrum sp.]
MAQSFLMIPFLFFLFGIVIGSFLNVCITRIPEGLSIVRPASRCPRCESPIKAYDNIPILSWLFLRAKCRHCGQPISPMYPIIEFLTGAYFVLTYYTFGITLPTFKWLFFGCLLIVLIVTDLRVRLLPDAVTFFGLGIGLAFATRIFPSSFLGIYGLGFRLPNKLPLGAAGVVDSLLGAAFGSLLLLGAAVLYKLIRHRDGMGMGDVKMMAMIGAFLGLRGAFLTILFGTLLGSIVGIGTVFVLYFSGWKRDLAARAARRGLGHGNANSLRLAIASQYQFPLGSFLGIAAFFVVYVLPRLLQHLLL